MNHPGESSADTLLARAGMRRAPFPKLELFQLRGFLPPDLCHELIGLIDANRRPSTIADPNGDHYFRTSETCDLDADEPAVRDLEARLLSLNGIDAAHGEPVQGQRYAVGQEFKAHTDYFEPDGMDFDRYCSVAGQRTWTFMIYLNEVEAGGGTRFSIPRKIVQPETGKLLAWNNRRPDGRPNPNTLHHGMKVRKGVKYVITKWYRELPWGLTPSIVGLARSAVHGFSKATVDRLTLLAGVGVVDDAHAGATVQHLSRVRKDPTQANLRQVHLIHAELFDELRAYGFELSVGGLGENVLTRGIDLLSLSAGTRLAMGGAILRVTGLRNPCAQIEAFRPGLLAHMARRRADGSIERRCGIMAVVEVGGVVTLGDAIAIGLPNEHRPLEPV